jgi:hypothetical protein
MLGLLPLLYLPLRAIAGAPGASSELATWQGFWNHVLARGFRGDYFYFLEEGLLLERLRIMVNVLFFQFFPIHLLAMAAGLALLVRRNRRAAFLLGGSAVVFIVVAAMYRAPQTVEYMMPAYIPMALLLALTVASLRDVPGRFQKPDLVRHTASAALVALLLVVGLQVLVQRWPNFEFLHGSYDTREYADQVLDGSPSGALVLADWHWATPLWYLQRVEGRRPDLTIEYVFPTGEVYAQTWVRRIQEGLDRGLVVVATHFDEAAYVELPVAEPLGEAFIYRQTPLMTLPADYHPIRLSLSDMVEVIGYSLEEEVVELGSELVVAVAWRPLAGLPVGAALFAHLEAGGHQVAAQDLPARPQAAGITLTQFRLTPGPLAQPPHRDRRVSF